MVFNCSGVGGFDSTTSRSNWRGGEEGFVGGYGPDNEACKSAKALIDGGDDG